MKIISCNYCHINIVAIGIILKSPSFHYDDDKLNYHYYHTWIDTVKIYTHYYSFPIGSTEVSSTLISNKMHFTVLAITLLQCMPWLSVINSQLNLRHGI